MKVPFTKNTPEIREFLKVQGFKGLSFFQGKEYIYAFLTTRANKDGEWKEKDFATFNEEDKKNMSFLMEEIYDKESFKESILKLS